MKLNLGCGNSIMPGWINVDRKMAPGVDVLLDLEAPGRKIAGVDGDGVSEFLASHVLEHVRNVLPLMQWCWDIAAPGALFTARVPYGSSDDADEDPTHVRRFFLGSWGYFGQPNYWRADYGYRGDWQVAKVTLICSEHMRGRDASAVYFERNAVKEMVAELVAIKPAREPKRELQRAPVIDLQIGDG